MFLKSKAETVSIFCIYRFICNSKPLKTNIASEILVSAVACDAVFLPYSEALIMWSGRHVGASFFVSFDDLVQNALPRFTQSRFTISAV